MKQNMASAPPKTWNRKNLPSDLERFGDDRSDAMRLLRQLPSATTALLRKRRGVVLLSLLTLSTLGLLWWVSRNDC